MFTVKETLLSDFSIGIRRGYNDAKDGTWDIATEKTDIELSPVDYEYVEYLRGYRAGRRRYRREQSPENTTPRESVTRAL